MDGFLIFLQSIRWQDIVDITLNSYILFRCYVIFRITNAFRILVGLAFLWIFQRIAVAMGLIVTSWVIQGITAVAALIIIVVFRNEIRSVLQIKNIKMLFWGFPQQSFLTPIQIIADSVMDLSRKRIGALIVFPGREDITEKIQNGILWDGAISKEMITSIFWEDNPVHDGAVIVEGDRIREVGVILPLSHRHEVPSHYGTRHRAAMGLAESTDSLVVVVSEERGTVQVVKGSSLTPVFKRDDLEQQLEQHLGLKVKDQTIRKKEKREIGIAAIVSLVLITSIWLSITRGLDSLVTFEIPIEYMNRNPGMEIMDASVNSVKIQLGGSGPLMRTIRPDHVRVKIDLGKSVAGQNIYTITHENISLPPGIVIKSFEPSVVDVSLDVLDKKDMPVQVDWTGKLPENLRMEKVKIDPSFVQIIGGRQLLKNITTAYTEKIPLESIRSSRTITVNLALSPASLKVAPGFKDKITVDCTVRDIPKNGQ
jgi:diadenylate cyclase